MISGVLFSTMLVVGVVWLYLMLYGGWPSDCTIPCQKPSAPTPDRSKGSKEPKPFLGLRMVKKLETSLTAEFTIQP
jgi:hypothetical protein